MTFTRSMLSWIADRAIGIAAAMTMIAITMIAITSVRA
jgi:hypothetical protein